MDVMARYSTAGNASFVEGEAPTVGREPPRSLLKDPRTEDGDSGVLFSVSALRGSSSRRRIWLLTIKRTKLNLLVLKYLLSAVSLTNWCFGGVFPPRHPSFHIGGIVTSLHRGRISAECSFLICASLPPDRPCEGWRPTGNPLTCRAKEEEGIVASGGAILSYTRE